MQQATFEVSVPKSILNYNLSSIDIQHYLNEWAVLHLFTDGQVSSDKAAQLLGITRLQFLELLRRRRISYLDYTPEELEEEFATVRQFKMRSEKQQHPDNHQMTKKIHFL
ncbi:MAG: UPF0175 family protein [Chloroflexota bacterium]